MSTLSEAITAGVVASMNPAAAMEREALSTFVETQKSEALVNKARAITSVAALLDDSSSTMSPAVKTAYEKILAQLSN